MAEDKTAVIAIVLVAIVAIVGLIGILGFGGLKGLTGAETSTGTVGVTLACSASLTTVSSTVAFGSGYVNGSCGDNAYISSSNDKGCWANTTTWLGDGAADHMTVRSDSTADTRLDIKSNTSAANFIGGTSPAQKYTVLNDGTGGSESASCSDANITSANTDYTTTDRWVCGTFDDDDDHDVLGFWFNLTIPGNDTLSGAKTQLITFTATCL